MKKFGLVIFVAFLFGCVIEETKHKVIIKTDTTVIDTMIVDTVKVDTIKEDK